MNANHGISLGMTHREKDIFGQYVNQFPTPQRRASNEGLRVQVGSYVRSLFQIVVLLIGSHDTPTYVNLELHRDLQ